MSDQIKGQPAKTIKSKVNYLDPPTHADMTCILNHSFCSYAFFIEIVNPTLCLSDLSVVANTTAHSDS